MRCDFHYSILYLLDGEYWTYTSCKWFGSQQAAIDNFPFNKVKILCTFKLRRNYKQRLF
jgi:hypothetical protein